MSNDMLVCPSLFQFVCLSVCLSLHHHRLFAMSRWFPCTELPAGQVLHQACPNEINALLIRRYHRVPSRHDFHVPRHLLRLVRRHGSRRLHALRRCIRACCHGDCCLCPDPCSVCFIVEDPGLNQVCIATPIISQLWDCKPASHSAFLFVLDVIVCWQLDLLGLPRSAVQMAAGFILEDF